MSLPYMKGFGRTTVKKDCDKRNLLIELIGMDGEQSLIGFKTMDEWSHMEIPRVCHMTESSTVFCII